MLKWLETFHCQVEIGFQNTIFWFLFHSGKNAIPFIYKALEVIVDHFDGHEVFESVDCSMLDACGKILVEPKEQVSTLHVLVFTSTQLLECSNLPTEVPLSAIG